MKNEKIFNIIGVLLGIIILIIGIYVFFTPAESYSTSSVSYYTFGADYYTEQYSATAAAVSNTAVTANNIRELSSKLAVYFGLSFMVVGALVILNYAKKLACSPSTTTSVKPNANETVSQTITDAYYVAGPESTMPVSESTPDEKSAASTALEDISQ